MKRIAVTLLIITLCLHLWPQKTTKKGEPFIGFEADKNHKQLNARYQNWLNMVAYIASAEEIKIFLGLPTIQDRDLFIKIFWQQRDPTSGTDKNEYQEQIEQRFRYVNKFFKRGTPRPGWKTDMGRIYMVLGPPNSIETVDNQVNLHPTQIWYYYGDKSLSLPTYFHITFFRRHGVGEWVLYSPLADGPASLFVSGDVINTSDFRTMYQKIQKLAPKLAIPSLSMLPNKVPYAYQPDLQNPIIMANIYKSPIKKINASYATNFLKYKGFVDVKSSIDFVNNSRLVSVNKDEESGLNLINFTIKPKKISINFHKIKEKYYFNYHLVVGLRQGEHVVYEYKKKFDYFFDEATIATLKSGGIVIHDSFPVLPGNYQLLVFIQNRAGNEFTYFDKPVEVPAPENKPFLASPLLAYKSEAMGKQYFFAYRFNNHKISLDPGKNFAADETPQVLIGIYQIDRSFWQQGYVQWQAKALSDRNPFKKSGVLALKDQPFNKNIHILFQPVAEKLSPDYYEITLKLFDPKGRVADVKVAPFIISPMAGIAKPSEMYSRRLSKNAYYLNYILGVQSRNIGDFSSAKSLIEKSVVMNPFFTRGLLDLLDLELKLRDYTQILRRVDQLKNHKDMSFPLHRIKGEALYGLKRYQEALTELLQANQIYNSNTRLINLIGHTFLKLNNRPEALKAFEASLKIDINQPRIKQIISRLKK